MNLNTHKLNVSKNFTVVGPQMSGKCTFVSSYLKKLNSNSNSFRADNTLQKKRVYKERIVLENRPMLVYNLTINLQVSISAETSSNHIHILFFNDLEFREDELHKLYRVLQNNELSKSFRCMPSCIMIVNRVDRHSSKAKEIISALPEGTKKLNQLSIQNMYKSFGASIGIRVYIINAFDAQKISNLFTHLIENENSSAVSYSVHSNSAQRSKVEAMRDSLYWGNLAANLLNIFYGLFLLFTFVYSMTISSSLNFTDTWILTYVSIGLSIAILVVIITVLELLGEVDIIKSKTIVLLADVVVLGFLLIDLYKRNERTLVAFKEISSLYYFLSVGFVMVVNISILSWICRKRKLIVSNETQLLDQTYKKDVDQIYIN